MITRTKFAKYLVDYLNQEFSDGVMPSDFWFFVRTIEEALEAFESTENATININGGNCPECGSPLVLSDANVCDNNGCSVSTQKYTCTNEQCDYEIYC